MPKLVTGTGGLADQTRGTQALSNSPDCPSAPSSRFRLRISRRQQDWHSPIAYNGQLLHYLMHPSPERQQNLEVRAWPPDPDFLSSRLGRLLDQVG